jgi:circadian clock protein KaiB
MQQFQKTLYDKDTASSLTKGTQKYVLKLFVAGMLQNSVRAIKNLSQVCEQYLDENYELSVIDIYQQPELAVAEQIIAIPVLIIKCPFPERRLIGDLSDTEKVLKILNIR